MRSKNVIICDTNLAIMKIMQLPAGAEIQGYRPC